jgi:hypothetical protein
MGTRFSLTACGVAPRVRRRPSAEGGGLRGPRRAQAASPAAVTALSAGSGSEGANGSHEQANEESLTGGVKVAHRVGRLVAGRLSAGPELLDEAFICSSAARGEPSEP